MSTFSRSKHPMNLWRRFSLNDFSRFSLSEGSPWCGDGDREHGGDDDEDPERLCWRPAGRLTRRRGSARPVSQGAFSRSQKKRKKEGALGERGAAHHSRSPLRPYARTPHPGGT